MLFNSLHFLFFFPVVCIIYFILPSLKARNLFLPAASYYFYMNWESAYALLLLTSTAITYLAALGIGACKGQRGKRLCLASNIVLNLSILFLFKYYNFAADNISNLLAHWGLSAHMPEFTLLLPVGISFYIFSSLELLHRRLPGTHSHREELLHLRFVRVILPPARCRPHRTLHQPAATVQAKARFLL